MQLRRQANQIRRQPALKNSIKWLRAGLTTMALLIGFTILMASQSNTSSADWKAVDEAMDERARCSQVIVYKYGLPRSVCIVQ